MKTIALFISFFFLLGSPKNSPVEDSDICLSKEEKLLYSMIMEYRKNNGLPPIPLSAKLTKVAKAHATDLAANYEFAPDNKCNPHSWSKKGNWSPCCYTADHKEAACMWEKPKEIAGYEGSGYEIAYFGSAGATAKEGLDGWKLSPGHNPLLINSGIWEKAKWQAIGIAIHKEWGLVWFGEKEDQSLLPDCN